MQLEAFQILWNLLGNSLNPNEAALVGILGNPVNPTEALVARGLIA